MLEPFAKRGEMDQGILRFTWYSLMLVAKGYALALIIGTPIGFLLGLSKAFSKDLRSDHPDSASGLTAGLAAAWIGLVPERRQAGLRTGRAIYHRGLRDVADGFEHSGRRARRSAGLSERRASVLKLSRTKTLFKVLDPGDAALYVHGFRLSLGIAWLVIVAAEMLTGRPGVGGFLWQEYNALIYEHIILCIITIGIVGFILDRLMSLVETRFKTA